MNCQHCRRPLFHNNPDVPCVMCVHYGPPEVRRKLELDLNLIRKTENTRAK